MPTGPNTPLTHYPCSSQLMAANWLLNKFSEWKYALYKKVPTFRYTDEYTRYCKALPYYDFEDVRDW
jgi:hypothetical protein